MTNENNMTEEERANSDKLEAFMSEKKKVHVVLKRKDNSDRNIFLNGYILRKVTPRVFVIREDVLGEIRLSISEIIRDGVNLHNDEKRGGRG